MQSTMQSRGFACLSAPIFVGLAALFAGMKLGNVGFSALIKPTYVHDS
jgi:F0F1-type ATP synthase membrane subunit c/vacuolar-type H+-ATPase subunit K